MKKTWILLKRGLLKPEHRKKLGVRVWLYMHMLDRANWDTGRIYEWRDKDEAEDMDMAWRTLQQQRQELDQMGYITCILQKDHQEIIIHKWVNPREYSGKEYNSTDGGTVNPVPSSGSTENEGTVQGTDKGTVKGISKVSTPSYRSQITDHISFYRDILDVWFELFPKKPQPRPNTKSLQNKVKTRMKEDRFLEIWWVALQRAADSPTLKSESWFDLSYFLRNDRNYEKCFDRFMEWKDKRIKDNGHQSLDSALEEQGYEVRKAA